MGSSAQSRPVVCLPLVLSLSSLNDSDKHWGFECFCKENIPNGSHKQPLSPSLSLVLYIYFSSSLPLSLSSPLSVLLSLHVSSSLPLSLSLPPSLSLSL